MIEDLFNDAVDLAPKAVALDRCECGIRLATTPCPDNKRRCDICTARYARSILREAKAERRRQARLFPPAMSIPKKRRNRT